jgi:shikimate dehydrogenase
MNENDPLPIDPHDLDAPMFVGDVIAGHGTTPLVAAAEKVGCTTSSGGQMVAAVQELMLDFLLGEHMP